MMPDQKEITRLLAEKYRVSPAQIEKAWNSQFKFLKEKIQQEDLPEIRIPFFGIFKPNEKRLEKFKQLKKQKEENDKDN